MKLIPMKAEVEMIDRLLQRLQTGWQPAPADIDPDVRQLTLKTWGFAVDSLAHPEDIDLNPGPAEFLIGLDGDGRTEIGEILWIDAEFRWALCAHAFFWLE